MPEEKYPYENIEMTNISHEGGNRYKPDTGFDTSKKSRSKHSKKIKSEIDSITNTIDSKSQKFNIDPKLIFKIEYERKISEDDLKRFGCDFLGDIITGNEAQIVFSNKERLKDFLSRWKKYDSGELTEGGNPKHYSFFNNIKSLKRLEPEDRKGPKIKNIDIDETKDYWVDVELWHTGNKDDCRNNQDDIEIIVGDNGRITDDYLGDSLHFLRMNLNGKALNILLDEERVCQIDLPPKLFRSFYQKVNIDVGDVEINDPLMDSPLICVIDSGVTPGHPLIENCIEDFEVFRDDLNDGIDENGHGTLVSGIALYGDIENAIENKSFEPVARLCSARVTDKEGQLGPVDKIYIKQIENAIKYYNENFGCRIFNISLGDPDRIYIDQNYQSRWAHILDNLARERNLIIVVSTGNIGKEQFINDLNIQNEDIRNFYPDFLFNEMAGLLEPSSAINCITTGALSSELRTSRNYFDDGPSKGSNRIPIASVDQPAPFTRTGPGFNNIIKPDFVAPGGNLYYDGIANKLISGNFESGIPSLNNKFIEESKLFSCDSGTSYSAPYITHMAAKILRYNSSFSNNTVRALLANSTALPEETIDLLNDYMEDQQLILVDKLKQLKDNIDSDELLEVIEDCISEGYINKRDKDKLLKSDEIYEDFKFNLRRVPGYKAEFDDFLARLAGYGMPDVDRALFSSENKVTIYAENEIELDKFDIYEIPIPEDFIDITGKRKITISLAYTPPVRHTRKDYPGFNLEFELIRGKDLEEVIKIAANEDKDKKYSGLGKYRCDKLSPKKSLIKTSTLQKASFCMKRTPKDYGDTYYLVVIAKDNWLENSADYMPSIQKENYSVAVTIEHEKEEVEMYQQVKQRVEQRIEQQARI
ncbi:MAG: S8 family peptidase [Bacillota bacterium]